MPTPVRIRRVHVTELRTAIDEARAALAIPALTYTDPQLAVGNRVRAPHVTELRAAVK